ncbi:10348_t:CDS:2 [Paraglomus occultum]|uniref:10348_t:CDS:1 n=1 Tax=Paraglomus occultum TaxID=144539 RepID=A0A9N9F906_9GLOM|nr:10348_t:CDS:2 [Paraglomus occultum]
MNNDVIPYSGYTHLVSYLKEHTARSYSEFLELHRSVILDSQPFSDDWSILDLTWSRRFLKQVKKLKSDCYEAVEKQVMYLILFLTRELLSIVVWTRSIGCYSNPSNGDGSSCLLLSGLGVLAVIPTSPLRLTHLL